MLALLLFFVLAAAEVHSIAIAALQDILNYPEVLRSPANDTVFTLPDSSVVSKHENMPSAAKNGNSLQDAVEVEAFGWNPFSPAGVYWDHHRVVDVQSYQEERVPISHCLDTTHGQAGSITVTHSTVLGVGNKAEFGVGASVGLALKLVLASAVSVSKTYSYSASASVPEGTTGQVFLSNPTIDQTTVDTVTYKVKSGLEKVDETQTTVLTLSPQSALQYSFVTSDRAPLQCST